MYRQNGIDGFVNHCAPIARRTQRSVCEQGKVEACALHRLVKYHCGQDECGSAHQQVQAYVSRMALCIIAFLGQMDAECLTVGDLL